LPIRRRSRRRQVPLRCRRSSSRHCYDGGALIGWRATFLVEPGRIKFEESDAFVLFDAVRLFGAGCCNVRHDISDRLDRFDDFREGRAGFADKIDPVFDLTVGINDQVFNVLRRLRRTLREENCVMTNFPFQ